MECYFIYLMIEQVNRGNRVGSTSNEQSWIDMTEEFNARFGLQYDKHFLEDQHFRLMRRHHNITNLLNCDGFTWEKRRQMVIADNDVWEANIKVHSSLH